MSQKTSVPSEEIISGYLNLLRRLPVVPAVAVSSLLPVLPVRDAARPCAIILSPHPDDECLTGALALRLLHEQNWQIITIAVTIGSNVGRRVARKNELAKACAVLGFDCVLPHEDGFSDVSEKTRAEDFLAWPKMVARVADMIAHVKPQAVFMPHALDAHPAHIGTHYLGMDALAKQAAGFTCSVIQTEYWHPLAEPNLMIGIGETDAATLLSALACHEGENARNPFDARFPAFLIDNVRRGSEIVGGAGVAAAAMDFAMLYKFGIWRGGKFVPSALKRMIGDTQAVGTLFE
jgi:LmbE family N-acetylglucosaminyl deacetylase